MAVKKRTCPRDSSPLDKEKRRGLLRNVQVDICPKCQGLFLDKGEIKSLTGHHDLNRLLTKYRGYDTPADPLTCPNGDAFMERDDAGGVKVDACLKCYGVWLDFGELEALRKTPESAFKRLTPEKAREVLMAKEIDFEQRDEAMRAAFWIIAKGGGRWSR